MAGQRHGGKNPPPGLSGGPAGNKETCAMREIVLDTETTGMEPADGDRLVEIGCVELHNHLPTGRHYHVYLNPECEVAAEAVAVHGLTNEFLKDKPTFSEIFTDFLD